MQPHNTVGVESLQSWRDAALDLEQGLNRALVGLPGAVRLLLVAVFARGHVLLEGDVGVGKTTLLRALARAIGGAYERMEGTVDLMPADVVYHTYLTEQGEPRVAPGPLLRHGERLSVFFFNEINRARPQVHSLMLRVMAERSVNAFNREHRFPHLLVFADRNRLEKDETFELPAALRDRFMLEIGIEMPADSRLQQQLLREVRYHDADALVEQVPAEMLDFAALDAVAGEIQRRVLSTDALERYALDLCLATRRPQDYGVHLDQVEDVEQLVEAGVSPRGMSMLLRAARVAAWLEGRDHVLPQDLHLVFGQAVAHRIFFTPVYELRRRQLAADFIAAVLAAVAAP